MIAISGRDQMIQNFAAAIFHTRGQFGKESVCWLLWFRQSGTRLAGPLFR
jgi:hypothetical protein